MNYLRKKVKYDSKMIEIQHYIIIRLCSVERVVSSLELNRKRKPELNQIKILVNFGLKCCRFF